MINRRKFLLYSATGLAIAPLRLQALILPEINTAINETDLIYVTTIRSNGTESACQSEIWFVWDDENLFVVTAASSWRARAASSGIDSAHIWIGDVGNWKSSKGAYRKLPQIDARASVVSDIATHDRVLALYAEKYKKAWPKWEPDFRQGLEDGERTMIRYSPQPAQVPTPW